MFAPGRDPIMTESSNTLQLKLLEARWGSGLTQEELATMTGLSSRTISDIECGRVTHPRAITLRLLAESLGMDRSETRELLLAAHWRAKARTPVSLPA
jgi:transcriptional regulator with XRE-family HTH domain